METKEKNVWMKYNKNKEFINNYKQLLESVNVNSQKTYILYRHTDDFHKSSMYFGIDKVKTVIKENDSLVMFLLIINDNNNYLLINKVVRSTENRCMSTIRVLTFIFFITLGNREFSYWILMTSILAITILTSKIQHFIIIRVLKVGGLWNLNANSNRAIDFSQEFC